MDREDLDLGVAMYTKINKDAVLSALSDGYAVYTVANQIANMYGLAPAYTRLAVLRIAGYKGWIDQNGWATAGPRFVGSE